MKSALRYILCLCFFLTAVASMQAQKDKKSKVQSSSQDRIGAAKATIESSPENSIRLLNEEIIEGLERGDFKQVIRSYELLGDINIDNGLHRQASERYLKAIEYASEHSSEDIQQELLYKSGLAFFPLNPEKAKKQFFKCTQITASEATYLLCYEGMADVEKSQNATRAIEMYREVEYYYQNINSPSLSRIQAKIAQSYAMIDDLANARSSYDQAQSNSSGYDSNSEDDAAIQKASKEISDRQTDEEDIDLLEQNVAYYEGQDDKQAEEKLELADAYAASGDDELALQNLDDIASVVDNLPNIPVKADYFKKKSELLASAGDYESAISAYSRYELIKDSIFLQKEALLNRSFSINEMQNKVDLSERDLINKQDKMSYQEELVGKQRVLIYLLLALLLGALTSAGLIYKNVRSKKRLNEILELRSLRAQMNPHFIFNSLGNLNEYIASHDERKANKFLSDFSKLMRSVLELNNKDLISLQDELELAELYLKLEHSRWSDKFEYNILVDRSSIPENTEVPPLLLQPYIENAVWHGLRYKESKGVLQLLIEKNAKTLEIFIEDNGIGRKKSLELKTENQKKYRSTGLRNTKRRSELIQSIYDNKIDVQMSDLDSKAEDTGTRVKITLG